MAIFRICLEVSNKKYSRILTWYHFATILVMDDTEERALITYAVIAHDGPDLSVNQTRRQMEKLLMKYSGILAALYIPAVAGITLTETGVDIQHRQPTETDYTHHQSRIPPEFAKRRDASLPRLGCDGYCLLSYYFDNILILTMMYFRSVKSPEGRHDEPYVTRAYFKYLSKLPVRKLRKELKFPMEVMLYILRDAESDPLLLGTEVVRVLNDRIEKLADQTCICCGQGGADLRCSRCLSYYCDAECQADDWAEHKTTCS